MERGLKSLRDVLDMPSSGLVRPVMSRKTKWIVALLALLVLCTKVEAGYSVASITVSAIVRNICTATTNVKRQDLKAVASINVEGEVSVDCALDTPFDISLNEGVVSGASVSEGIATSADNTLAFNVFEDSAHTKAWGTMAGPGSVSGTYGALQHALPIHGVLADGQSAKVPNAERLTITVNY